MKHLVSLMLLFSVSVSVSVSAATVEFMTYNMENLFDAQHDEGKNDWSYLPKKTKGKKEKCEKLKYDRYRRECLRNDWNQKRLILKLRQVKWALDINRETLPEFLAIQEVENPKVASLLAERLGYKSYKMTNSPDKRGIDVALLYSENKDIKFVAMKEHEITGKHFEKKPTRNILEVEFKINKKPVTIFVNHWPSLGNPTVARIAAAKVLKARIDRILSNNGKHSIVALGDFNTIDENHPHPFRSVLTEDGHMKDMLKVYMSSKSIDRKKKKAFPLGTYFYPPKMQWNMLDRIFVSKNLVDGKNSEIELDSFHIHNPRILTSVYEYTDGPYKGSRVVGVPKDYDHTATKKNKAGFSDHFAVSVKAKF